MQELTTDVAIIGAGTAGLNARREVERVGKRWLLIESGVGGTTCARVGCMPSKLLIAAAEVAHSARNAAPFGIAIDEAAIRIDGPAVLARVQRERDHFVASVHKDVAKLPAELRLAGKARFEGPTTLRVDDHTRIRAKAVVIATGSTPVIPKELEGLGDALLTSDSVFEERDLMRSVAVFGAGAIGLELGQALQFLGVRVRIYNPKESVGAFSHPDVAKQFKAALQQHHDLVLGYKDLEVERDGDGCIVRHRDASGEWHSARFDKVLVAAGRKPELATLQLSAAQLELDEKGGLRFDPTTMQCGDSPVFIAGDASAHSHVMHEAVDEGAIAGSNAALFPDSERFERRTPLRIGFTTPRMATVGKTFAALEKEKAKTEFVVGESSYETQGRARVINQRQGLVRVYASCGGRTLLGAELFGPGVEHTAHLLAWAVAGQVPLAKLLQMPVYHPTLEEGIRTALRDAAKKLDMLSACKSPDLGIGPGL